MLDVDSTVSYFNDSVRLSHEFVDAMERKNLFDMDRAFMELTYDHLELISKTTVDADLSASIREDADSMSLEGEMLRSSVGEFYGRDIGKEDQLQWETVVRQRDEAMKLAKDAMTTSEGLLAVLKHHLRDKLIAAGVGIFAGAILAVVRYEFRI